MIHAYTFATFESTFIADLWREYINIGNEHYLSLNSEHQGQALIGIDGICSEPRRLLSAVQSGRELRPKSQDEGKRRSQELLCVTAF